MALCSIGIAAGIIGLALIVKRLVRHGRLRGEGEGHYRRCRRGGGPGRSRWLRAIFDKLDTTPGQEREIREAIEELQTVARDVRTTLFGSRESVAKALAGEVFDSSATDEASASIDAASARVKNALRDALGRVHAVLDAKQRERLGELLVNGPSWGRRAGPYR